MKRIYIASKKNVPLSKWNIFRNNSCRPTFNVSIFKIRYSGEKFTENQCWWSFTFSISFSDWYFTGFVSLFSLKSNLYRGGSCPVCMPRELMLMMITTVGTSHIGSEGKVTFRLLLKSTIRIDAIVFILDVRSHCARNGLRNYIPVLGWIIAYRIWLFWLVVWTFLK